MTMILANFTAFSSEQIANGDFCEKFSLKKANVLSDARKTNDFFPRTQLNKLLECCGKPELSRESVACEDGSVKVTPVDSNNTMDKVLGGLESLIEQFTGEDFRLPYSLSGVFSYHSLTVKRVGFPQTYLIYIKYIFSRIS